MRKLADLFYGDIVRIKEFENGYRISKNRAYSITHGDAAVFYVGLPRDRRGIMIDYIGSSTGEVDGVLCTWSSDFEDLLDDVADTEAEARVLCRKKANEFAAEIARETDRIVFEPLAAGSDRAIEANH